MILLLIIIAVILIVGIGVIIYYLQEIVLKLLDIILILKNINRQNCDKKDKI